ncbi:MAG: CBS domain-containing protein [Hadesarchaea archaeon]|nr:CBS domain-containing protein [Candidatus Bipolaricaulota bacterium]MBC7218541.1 CBS domain-containing protein [Hadesarchaea archaeon]
MKEAAGPVRGPTISDLSVEEIMTKNVITVETEEPVFTMVKKMINKNVECLPVTKAGKLKGLITFRDVIRKVVYEGKDPKKMKAKDVMTKSVVTCYNDATVLDVVKLMKNKRLRRIPVIDRNRNLVGLVTNFDLAIIGWDVD